MSNGLGESHLTAGFFPLIATGASMAATDTCTCAAVLTAELICGGLCSALSDRVITCHPVVTHHTGSGHHEFTALGLRTQGHCNGFQRLLAIWLSNAATCLAQLVIQRGVLMF